MYRDIERVLPSVPFGSHPRVNHADAERSIRCIIEIVVITFVFRYRTISNSILVRHPTPFSQSLHLLRAVGSAGRLKETPLTTYKPFDMKKKQFLSLSFPLPGHEKTWEQCKNRRVMYISIFIKLENKTSCKTEDLVGAQFCKLLFILGSLVRRFLYLWPHAGYTAVRM